LTVVGVAEPEDPPEDVDAVIAADGGPTVLRIAAREDLVIARQVAGISG
jgi:hypothetical protein